MKRHRIRDLPAARQASTGWPAFQTARLIRSDGLEAGRGITTNGGGVTGMDSQEYARMPGPGQAGQPRGQVPAQALASLNGIEHEPRQFHLGLLSGQSAATDGLCHCYRQ
jgi:hypothetical protein